MVLSDEHVIEKELRVYEAMYPTCRRVARKVLILIVVLLYSLVIVPRLFAINLNTSPYYAIGLWL